MEVSFKIEDQKIVPDPSCWSDPTREKLSRPRRRGCGSNLVADFIFRNTESAPHRPTPPSAFARTVSPGQLAPVLLWAPDRFTLVRVASTRLAATAGCQSASCCHFTRECGVKLLPKTTTGRLTPYLPRVLACMFPVRGPHGWGAGEQSGPPGVTRLGMGR